jgi:nitrogen-specific signal transduction histidine kinase
MVRRLLPTSLTARVTTAVVLLMATVSLVMSALTTAATRDSGGAGLGLSLAQSITEAHGGAITVVSEPGSTSFTLALPRPSTS